MVSIMEGEQDGLWQILSSTPLWSEAEKIPSSKRKLEILSFLRQRHEHIKMTATIQQRAQALGEMGFHIYDAFHVACAEAAHADLFLTTDKQLLNCAVKNAPNIKVTVRNPAVWLNEHTL